MPASLADLIMGMRPQLTADVQPLPIVTQPIPLQPSQQAAKEAAQAWWEAELFKRRMQGK